MNNWEPGGVMRQIIGIAAAVLTLTSVSSCGSNSPASPSALGGTATSSLTSTAGDSTSKGSITMLVDSVPWSATSGVTAIRTSGILSIAGTDPTWNLSFAVAANAPGTFVIPGPAGPQAGNNALLLLMQNGTTTGSWAANSTQGNGTVTITSLTLTAVSGTFAFSVLPASGTAVGGKILANGTFSISF